MAAPTFGPDAVAVDQGADVGLPFRGGAPDIGAVETGCQFPFLHNAMIQENNGLLKTITCKALGK